VASVTIAHHPELTAEDLVAIFQKQFGGKYEIIPTPRQPLFDLIVRRSAWTGIFVHLKQTRDKTKLVFWGNPPSAWARLIVVFSVFASFLLFGLVFWQLLVWKEMTDEVRAFIETADQFR